MNKLFPACLVLAAALLAMGCEANSNAKHDPQAKLKIVATTGMVADMVRSIAGEHAEVVALMGESVDPHLYKPTREAVKLLTEADVVCYNGLLLEGRMGDTFAALERSGKPVIVVTAGLEKSYLRVPPEFEGHPDPHVWMDVSAWRKCVSYTAGRLAEVDPPHAEAYRAAGEAYAAELDRLDQYVKTTIASIPEKQRVLVTAHDAFGYFARAYGMEEKSIQGISTESEAGVDDVNQLVEFIVSREVPAIFVESSVSPKNVQAVIEGAVARGRKVEQGGELFSDAMGAAGTYEGTYVGMIDHNATLITRALGGEAPAGGFQGKLAAAK